VVTVRFSDLAGASLTGDGLSVNGDGLSSAAGPVQVGSLGTLDGSFRFVPRQTLFNVIVNGTPYAALLDGMLTFTTTPFITPPPTGDCGVFQTTFAMIGHVRGLGAAPEGARPTLFDIALDGSGTASGNEAFRGGIYLPQTAVITYNFADTAATPEPASMILLGTGVAGLMVRCRKRT